MKWIKLFEAHNTDEKIETANILIFEWIIFNIVVTNELEVKFDSSKRMNPYTFNPSPSSCNFFKNDILWFSINIDKKREDYYSVYYINWEVYDQIVKISRSFNDWNTALQVHLKKAPNELSVVLSKAAGKALFKYLKLKNIDLNKYDRYLD